jgi:hypothetical protein
LNSAKICPDVMKLSMLVISKLNTLLPAEQEPRVLAQLTVMVMVMLMK